MKIHISEKKVIMINPGTRQNIIATTCQFSHNFEQEFSKFYLCCFYKVIFFFFGFLYFKWIIRGQIEIEEKHKTWSNFCHLFFFFTFFVCFLFVLDKSTLSTSTHDVSNDDIPWFQTIESYVLHKYLHSITLNYNNN